MPCFLVASSMLTDILQLLFMLLVFVVVIAAACYTTRFLVKAGYIQGKTSNIELKESFRIAPNKSIQIIKIGTKYVAVAVGKDEVTFLAELSEEELEFPELPQMNSYPAAFSEIMNYVKKKRNLKESDEESSLEKSLEDEEEE